MVSPLADYMPGVRKGIVADLPRKRLALAEHRALAQRLQAEGYGEALIMPRTWKSALAPFLAGIPVRTGFFGEARFGLLNDLRSGETRAAAHDRPLRRARDAERRKRCRRLAASATRRAREPRSRPGAQRAGLADDRRPAVALAPGAVGPSKRWTDLRLRRARAAPHAKGAQVWVLGGPDERALAAEIAGPGETNARDLTGPDLRNAILALAAADVAVSNDFRPSACRRRDRHAGDRDFRPDQPVALGAAQPAGGRRRDRDRAVLPALPQADLPRRPSSLHARHRGGTRLALTRKALGERSNVS